MMWLKHLKNGLKEKYPLCCIIAFCMGARAEKAGIVFRNGDKNDSYVPCPIHRSSQNYHSYREALLLLNDGVLPLPESNFNPNGSIGVHRGKTKPL